MRKFKWSFKRAQEAIASIRGFTSQNLFIQKKRSISLKTKNPTIEFSNALMKQKLISPRQFLESKVWA